MAPSTIEKWMSWPQLAEMVGANPGIDPAARLLGGWGSPFELEELERAVALAAAALPADTVLTAKRYVAWARTQDPERVSERVPASTTPFARFGGFLAVRRRALGSQPARNAVSVEEQREQLKALLRAARADLDRAALTFGEVQAWWRERVARGAVEKGWPDCFSRRLVQRLFSDWDSACRAAGFRAAMRSGSAVASPPGARGQYSTASLIARLRELGRASEGTQVSESRDPSEGAPARTQETGSGAGHARYLTHQQFMSLQVELAERAEREGRSYRRYSMDVMLRRFGTWPNALYQAGLIDNRERRRLNAAGCRRVSDTRIIEVVREAAQQLGDQMTRASYDRWVHDQIQTAGDDTAPYPVGGTVSARLGEGSFRDAVTRALAAPGNPASAASQVEAGAGARERPAAPPNQRGGERA